MPKSTSVPEPPSPPENSPSENSPTENSPENTAPENTVPETTVPETTVTRVVPSDEPRREPGTVPPPVQGTVQDRAPSRFRSGALPFLLGAATVVVVIVLAGGTSWVVARAAAAEPAPAPTASAKSSTKAGDPMRGMAEVRAVRGTVQSIADGTWTVQTKDGRTVSVTVGDHVRFVRQGTAATAADFRVGDAVVIVGTRSGEAIDAKRIAIPKPNAATPGA